MDLQFKIDKKSIIVGRDGSRQICIENRKLRAHILNHKHEAE